MDANIDTRNIKHIKITCDHATVDGLSLDLSLVAPGENSQEGQDTTFTTASKPTPRLVAKEHERDGKFHLLLAASGSVATIKIPNIVQKLSKHSKLSIRIILTESAAKFLQGQSEEQPHIDSIAKHANVDAIYRDVDEWKVPWVRGAPILHIELRRWADLLVIAPLSANTLAKISNGICDNLLTSVVRAWQVEPISDLSTDATTSQVSAPQQKRIFIAPAMNTAMWRHPLTSLHLRSSEQNQYYHWFDIMRPVEKTLACGDTGDGAMCDWNDIVAAIEARLLKHVRALSGSVAVNDALCS